MLHNRTFQPLWHNSHECITDVLWTAICRSRPRTTPRTKIKSKHHWCYVMLMSRRWKWLASSSVRITTTTGLRTVLTLTLHVAWFVLMMMMTRRRMFTAASRRGVVRALSGEWRHVASGTCRSVWASNRRWTTSDVHHVTAPLTASSLSNSISTPLQVLYVYNVSIVSLLARSVTPLSCHSRLPDR